MKKSLAACIALISSGAWSQVPITEVYTYRNESARYNQDFNGLASGGTTGTVLPSEWEVLEIGASADSSYRVSHGDIADGDTYSYGPVGGSDRALGVLPSSTVSQIHFGVPFVNLTGNTVSSFSINLVAEQWHKGGNVAQRLVFSYSLDATSLDTGTWTYHSKFDIPQLQSGGIEGALDGNANGNWRYIADNVGFFGSESFNWLNNSNLWVRWSVEFQEGGGNHGLSLDGFSFAAVPEPQHTAWFIGVTALGFAVFRKLRKSRAG